MAGNFPPSVSLRPSRRLDHNLSGHQKGGKLAPDCSMKITWKMGFIRLVLVAGIIWMLLILSALLLHIWSCQSSVVFFSAFCNKESRVFSTLNSMGLVKPAHRKAGASILSHTNPHPNSMGYVKPAHRKAKASILSHTNPRPKIKEKKTRTVCVIYVFFLFFFLFIYFFPLGCPIPVADDPNIVVIPKKRSPDRFVQSLSYIMEDEMAMNGSQSIPLFGGHETWQQREESFKVKPSMKVRCGFMENSGAEMDPKDSFYVKKCQFVVASGIFDGYDIPFQPSNVSERSQKLFCFLMVVDEVSYKFIKKNVTVREDEVSGKWVGIWRLVLLKHPPYDEPRRNGKVPKILTHRLFPQAQYSIWIDGKMELIVDPLLILERYLWRGKHTFAIAQHKHHRSIYQEADANKRRKRYARPLIELQMKIYRHEGMEPWNPEKNTKSDVPEGAIIIREHTALNNLFSCLWFNEVDLFTPRDQLSFGHVVYRLGGIFKFFMFPNCEYNSIFILHPHVREHSSRIEWVKSLTEFEKDPSLKETRGGLGFWTPYPGNLDLVVLPPVARTSKAG